MAKVTWKGGTLIAPIPAVMVTCGNNEKANVLTIAWTGIINTIPPMTYISVRPSRHSYNIIKDSGEFVINLTTEQLCRATDYCGVRSGKDHDKLKDMKLELEPSSIVSAPQLKDSPLSLECKVKEIKPLGSHDMFIADIVAVNVDEKLIDKNGRLDLKKADLIAYSHGDYYKLGDRIGDFGFSVRKKQGVTKKRPPRIKKNK